MRKATDAERWELVLANQGFVHQTAYHFWTKLRSLEKIRFTVDDLVQVGLVCAFECSKRWDPEKGKFTTFLNPCLRGKLIDVVFPHRRARIPIEVPASLDYEVENADSGDYVTLKDSLVDLTAEAAFQQVDIDLDLEQVLSQMTPRNRYVVERYLQGEKMQTIADELGVTESRISQIFGQEKVRLAS